MTFYGGCNCGVIGCNGRHSIDRVSGRPIFVEDYVIPVFQGSTLETEFQFPFTITSDHSIFVVSEDYPILEDATVSDVSDTVVSIRWEADIIETLEVGSNSTFRVKVINSNTNDVKVYNLITIRVF